MKILTIEYDGEDVELILDSDILEKLNGEEQIEITKLIRPVLAVLGNAINK